MCCEGSSPLTEASAARPATGFRALLGERVFARFLGARFLSSLAIQMQTVAVGWQIYALTGDPLQLGLVGLSQFLPFVLLVLVAGHAADRFRRTRILMVCYLVELSCAALLFAFTLHGFREPWPILAVMSLMGVARAFTAPAQQSLMPNLVPPALFANAVGVNSSAWQVATIVGPALGGLLYLAGPLVVYGNCGILLVAATLLMAGVRAPAIASARPHASWRTLLEGLVFVRSRPVILGAISMDLFAVLFGGATALLPAYARDILHVGPDGLGLLRAAPGVGAALMAAWLTARPISDRVGSAMFGGVVVFGLMTIVFGLSTSLALSLGALLLLGAADMVSVFIRHMLVQLETPDALRGRVSAVNAMFIGASNELGEFESGVTAAWWGIVPAVVVGGVATLVVALLWARWFPALRRMTHFPSPVRRV
jgi:MFS family permease